MKKKLIRYIHPNSSSSLKPSDIILKKKTPFIFKKINPILNSQKNEIKKNASLDYKEMKHPRFNINRKISKSSSLKQRIGSYSNIINKNPLFLHKNVYEDFIFKRAPSLNRNISDIHHIINTKRNRKIKYLDNLFFNSKFSNEYLDDLYRIRKNNILFQYDRSKIKLLERNNSCGELKSLSHRRITNFDSPENELSTNNSNIIKVKNNISSKNNNITGKNILNNNSNISTTTYRSINTNRFPEIYSNSNVSINEEQDKPIKLINSPKISLPKISQSSLNINSRSIDTEKFNHNINEGNGSFITSLGVEKMKYKLNEAMFENFKTNKKINEFEKNILKLKIIQSYQKESLKEILNDNRFNIQEKIDHIINMYKIYEEIYEEYKFDLSRYINFLYLVTSDFEVELEIEIKKKRALDYDVESLVDRLISVQKNLEYLIGLRNFLFSVKNKGRKIINLNEEYVYYISKRNQFIERLLDIFDRENNTIATRYLKKLIKSEELESFLSIKKNNKSRPNTIKKSNKTDLDISNKSEELCPPPPGEIIFDQPEEFQDVLEKLEDRTLYLLKEYENIRLRNIELRKKLNQYKTTKEDWQITKINEDIDDRMRLLKNLKERNLILNQRKESINSLHNNKNNIFSLNKKTKQISSSFLNNLNYFHMINYDNQIKKYKYPGLFFLEKLIYHFNHSFFNKNEFSKLFNISECEKYLPYNLLISILKTKKEFFNDKNQYLIIDYILQLIKLFEYLCEFILNKNEQYRKNYPSLYKKYNEEIQNERKVSNARTIRKLIEEKREINAKKLFEKWGRKPNVMGRKLDLDIKPFYLERNLSQGNLRGKKRENIENLENYKLLMDNL